MKKVYALIKLSLQVCNLYMINPEGGFERKLSDFRQEHNGKRDGKNLNFTG